MQNKDKNQVVITAAGPVTALGLGQDCFSEGIAENESGIMEIAAFEHEKYAAHTAAAVEDFEVDDYLPTPKNYLDRNTELAFGAFSLALAESGIDLDNTDKSQIALLWGTAFGGSGTMDLFYKNVQEKGPRFGKPILFPHTYSNTAISMLSIEYKLNGPHMNFVSGWTASGQALVYGHDLIATDRIPTAFVGGAEAFNKTIFRYCLSKNLLATDNNTGTFLGEGAGMLVLESANSANKRGAKVLAEIAGVGMAGSIADAMKKALGEIDNVDMVVTSADGIPAIDNAEKEAINQLLNDVETFSAKALIGETCGAAGILNIHAALSLIEKQNKQTILVNNSDIHGNAVSFILRQD